MHYYITWALCNLLTFILRGLDPSSTEHTDPKKRIQNIGLSLSFTTVCPSDPQSGHIQVRLHVLARKLFQTSTTRYVMTADFTL